MDLGPYNFQPFGGGVGKTPLDAEQSASVVIPCVDVVSVLDMPMIRDGDGASALSPRRRISSPPRLLRPALGGHRVLHRGHCCFFRIASVWGLHVAWHVMCVWEGT